MISDVLDLVILGSGFTGQVISREFAKTNLKFELLDISQTRIEFADNNEGVFSQIQLNKTANFGGGISVWGNALTYPLEHQYFMDPQNLLWNQVGKKLPLKSGLNEFGVELSDFELNLKEKRFLEKKFPKIASEFNLEVNCYSKKWRSNTKLEKLNNFKQPTTCEIKDIKQVEGIWHIVCIINSKENTLISRNVVFASGAIANACLVFIATNRSEFFIGNHISAKAGRISLHKRKILGPFTNIPERKFLTFSIRQNASAIRCAIRFQLRYSEGNSKLNISEFFKKLEVLISILGFQKNLNVLIMAEHFDINSRLLISKSENGSFHCLVKSKFDPSKNLEISNLLNAMKSYFDKIGVKSEFAKNKDLIWADAAHYFGTLPIKSKCDNPFVDENYRICGVSGLYAVGASTFARGSHGHPTLLATTSAIDFSEKFKLNCT